MAPASQSGSSISGFSSGASSLGGSSIGGTTVISGTTFLTETERASLASRTAFSKLVEKGFIGVFNVPCTKWEQTWRYSVIYQFFEYLQLVLFALLPYWHWNFSIKDNVALHWVFRGMIQTVAVDRGISSVLVMQYICGVIICLNGCFFAFVVYMSRANKPIPKVVLSIGRLPIVFLSQMFLPSMGALFLIMSSCDWNGRKGPKYHYLYFPQTRCFEGSNKLHAITGAIFFIVHCVIGLAASFRYTDANVGGGIPNVMYGGYWLFHKQSVRYLLIITSHLMTGWRPELASFCVFFISAWMCVIKLTALPFGNRSENAVNIGIHFVFLYMGILLFIKESVAAALSPKTATVALAAGFAPAFLVGVAAYYLRTFYVLHVFQRFTDLYNSNPNMTPDAALDHINLKYWVEPVMIIRMHLVRLGGHKGTEEQEAVLDFVCRVALHRFENNTFVQLAVASVKVYHLGDATGGHNQAEAGGKKAKNWVERLEYFLFEKKIKRSAINAEEGADLSNYLEFAGGFKLVLHYHKKALLANRRFWMHVMHKEVKMSNLVTLTNRIRELTEKADTQYRQLIEQFPRSVGLLRSYGRFLEECRLDLPTATRYITEADKLEERIMTANREAAEGGAKDGSAFQAALTDLDGSAQAVIMIDPNGIIVYANKAVCALFGYRAQDIVGKLVNNLMPPPFSKEHGSYLTNYQTTGVAKILNTNREVVALHRERHVFAINLQVRKVSSQGQTFFMGAIDPVPVDESVCLLWLSPQGLITLVNQNFEEMTGWKSANVVGKSFTTLLDDSDDHQIEEILRIAKTLELGGEESERIDIQMRHAFSVGLKAKCSIKLSGTENVTLIALSIYVEGSSSRGFFTINSLGKITYANSQFCRLTGYTAQEIHKIDIMQLAAEPFGKMHVPWLKGENFLPSHGNSETAPRSCLDGRIVELKSKTGRPLTVRLRARESSSDEVRRDGKTWDCTANVEDPQAAALAHRWSLRLDTDGNVTDISGTTESFGLELDAFRGLYVADVLGLPQGNVAKDYVRALIANQDVVYRRLMLKRTDGGEVPAVVRFAPMTGDSNSMALIEVYNPVRVEGILICDRHGAGKILDADLKAQAIFGFSKDRLVNGKRSASDLLQLPGMRVDGLLIDETAKRGGFKAKHLGPPRTVDGVHADGDTLRLVVIASAMKGDKIAVYVSVTGPTVSPLPDFGIDDSHDDGDSPAPAANPVAPEPLNMRLQALTRADSDEHITPRRAAGGFRRGRRAIVRLSSDGGSDVEKGKTIAPPPAEAAKEKRDLSPMNRQPKSTKVAPPRMSDHPASVISKIFDDASHSHDDDQDSDAESLASGTGRVKDQTIKWVEDSIAQMGLKPDDTELATERPEPERIAIPLDGTKSMGADAAALLSPVPSRKVLNVAGTAGTGAASTAGGFSAAQMTIEGGMRHDHHGNGPINSMDVDDTEGLKDKEISASVMATEAEKTKRHHRLLRLLDSPRAREGITHLKRYGAIGSLAVLIVAQLIQFLVLTSEVNKFSHYISNAADSGEQTAALYRILTHANVIECYGRRHPVGGCTRDMYLRSAGRLLQEVENLQGYMDRLYLGKGSGIKADTPGLKLIYNTPNIPTLIYSDGLPKYELSTLFDASNAIITNGRTIALMSENDTSFGNLASDSSFLYLMNNYQAIAPLYLESCDLQVDRGRTAIISMNKIFVLFMVIGSIIVTLAVFIYMTSKFYRVQVERHRAFAGFKHAPAVALLTLAQRPTKLDADDDVEEDDESEDALMKRAMMSGAAAADRKRKKAESHDDPDKKGKKVEVKGLKDRIVRRIQPRHLKVLSYLVWPVFPLWFGITVACVATSYSWMRNNVQTLYLMKSQAIEDVALSEIVFWGQMVVGRNGTYQPDQLLTARDGIGKAGQYLRMIHTVNMYGNPQWNVAGNLLRQNYYYNAYYSIGCMRSDKHCVGPENQWYWFVTRGLDCAFFRMIETADTISQDETNLYDNWGNRNQFVAVAGDEDVRDGSITSVQIVLKNGSYVPAIIQFQTAALIIICVGAAIFFLFTVRPYIAAVELERTTVALLLAELPKSHDVETLLLDSFADPKLRQHSWWRRALHHWRQVFIVVFNNRSTFESRARLAEAKAYFAERNKEDDSDSDEE